MTSRSIVILFLLVCSFRGNELEDLLTGLQQEIQKPLRFTAETDRAKTKLEVTPTGFVRYTQAFKSGKQSYGSLNLGRFLSMDYLGDSGSGFLILRSQKNDVIVQTYHDRSGDVDSMSTHLDIPLESVSPEQLNTMESHLQRIKVLLLQK